MRAAADLTGLALIRESAMRLTADRGWAAVSIRDIAADAGVSSSLVVHHFGTKARLREAVDTRVTEVFAELLGQLGDADAQAGEFTSIAAAFHDRVGSDGVVLAYLRRLLIDGGPAATALFGSLYAATVAGLAELESAGALRPTADTAARAAFLLINDLAVVLLRDEVARVLGVDPLSRPGLRRWGNTVMEIYRGGAFTTPETEGRKE
ncbi:MAG TPA: TetR family transcriptional regulator [Nakamurella sp.]